MHQFRLFASLLITLAGLALSGAGVGARAAAQQAASSGVWNSQDHCIRNETSLPAVQSVAGDAFIVRRQAAYSSAAQTVADTIRSQDVFGVYEQGMGIATLNQSGQSGNFPIFVDTGLPAGLVGITAPMCSPNQSWVSLIVAANVASHAELVATIDHELFHAAQLALLGTSNVAEDWWLEATATAAETWFGSTEPAQFDNSVLANPKDPMPSFIGPGDEHPYGAYLFVKWLLDSAVAVPETPPAYTTISTNGFGPFSRPTAAGWAFLRNSFTQVAALGPESGVSAAITAWNPNETLGEEVASFWADHTNPHPAFGAQAHLPLFSIIKSSETFSITPSPSFATNLRQFRPDSSVQQMEIIVKDVPADVEAWINLGDKSYWVLQPGESLNETFCRSGFTTNGSYTLPSTGDVRVALTTTGSTPPPDFQVKILASTTPCPKQYVIVPGLGIGALHLGMSKKEADSAASLISCTGGQYCTYSEGPDADVNAFFMYNSNHKQRLAELFVQLSRRFITTTGITTFELIPSGAVIPGSTEPEFIATGHNVRCRTKNEVSSFCDYQLPAGRYTFASAPYEACKPGQKECYWPAPGYYVAGIILANQQAYNLIKNES